MYSNYARQPGVVCFPVVRASRLVFVFMNSLPFSLLSTSVLVHYCVALTVVFHFVLALVDMFLGSSIVDNALPVGTRFPLLNILYVCMHLVFSHSHVHTFEKKRKAVNATLLVYGLVFGKVTIL